MTGDGCGPALCAADRGAGQTESRTLPCRHLPGVTSPRARTTLLTAARSVNALTTEKVHAPNP